MSILKKIKENWLYLLLTTLVVAYLVTMTVISSALSAEKRCAGIEIVIDDAADCRFVAREELARELGDLPKVAKTKTISSINIDSLERVLDAFDKIETVSVNILSNGVVRISVVPMQPVARIFDTEYNSYYINRSGKKIKADARYHIDVPVIVGNFKNISPQSLIPLLDRIDRDSLMKQLVSMVKVDSPNDILLIPTIRGHVINLGDTLGYDDKFRRISAMYTEVMKVKGWEYYDTISVKWDGQVVACRRDKSHPEDDMIVETENKEAVDVSTMMSGPNVAPGQALPDRPVHNEKLIPGAKIPEPAVKPSEPTPENKEPDNKST